MSSYETRLFINGKLVNSQQGKTFDLLSPIDNSRVAKVPIATEGDVDAAVEAAEKAQPFWAALPAYARADALRRFSQLLVQNASKLAELDAICMGRPINAHQEDVEEARRAINYFAGLVELAYGESSLDYSDHVNLSLRQPFGVVASIVPWNFPVLLFCLEFGPACGAGNALILKTSEKSPLSGILLAQLATQAGFPPGIINVVSGAGYTGELLASHMKIRKISLTGSARAGRAVLQAAARSNLKNVALELGGKSPLIVFLDADLEAAAKLSSRSITINAGQICTASSRVYVQKPVANTFKSLLQAEFKALKLGSPMDKSTGLGPQADATQSATVARYLDIGNRDGDALIGGKRASVGPNFIEPTIFTNIPDKSQINTEEVFGPVLVVHEFETEAEVIRRANDTEYGLYASVFSLDINRALRVARALEAGSVGVNTTSPDGSYNMPFGGYKTSGIGRQKGSNAVKSWLEEKGVIKSRMIYLPHLDRQDAVIK